MGAWCKWGVSSLGGIKDLGFLGVMRGMDVQKMSLMECIPGTIGVECKSGTCTDTNGGMC